MFAVQTWVWYQSFHLTLNKKVNTSKSHEGEGSLCFSSPGVTTETFEHGYPADPLEVYCLPLQVLDVTSTRLKLTKLSGDRRHNRVLSDLWDRIKVGLSGESHRCVRETDKHHQVTKWITKPTKNKLSDRWRYCWHWMSLTCDRFLIALPQVDQVPQARVELIHHNLERTVTDWQVVESISKMKTKQLHTFCCTTTFYFRKHLQLLKVFFLQKKGLARIMQLAIFTGVGGRRDMHENKCKCFCFCSINTAMWGQ